MIRVAFRSSDFAVRCVIFAGLAAISVTASASASEPLSEGGASSDTRAKFIVQGALHNEELFRQFSCDVDLAYGRCGTVEDAMADGPSKGVSKASAKHIVSGDSVLYRRTSDEQLVQSAPGSDIAGATLTSWSMLYSGGKVLSFSGNAFASTVDKSNRYRGVDFTTWNGCGLIKPDDRGSFGRYCVELLNQDPKCVAVTSDSSPSPRSNSQLTVVTHRFNSLRFEWFVNEERGFIAEETRMYIDDQLFATAYVTDIQKTTNGGWFPTRCIKTSPVSDSEIGDAVDVLEVSITNLDLKRPSDADFELVLPERSSVNDHDHPTSAFVLKEPETVSVKSLDSLYDRTQQRVRERSREAGSGFSWAKWTMLCIGGVATAIGVALFVFRKKSA